MKTTGISPKVKAFLATVGGPGVILLVLGCILDVAELRAAGLALIGGAGVGGLSGYQAAPGDVAVNADDISAATRNPEAGYGLVELAVAVLILAVAVLIILRVA